jgi:16S rRNA (adenine1518-N6/adenine1519-N6)-dimethyltransferase
MSAMLTTSLKKRFISNMLAKKSLGQNFLMHPQIAERIVHEARVPSGMPVLEIGPGTGLLTHALLSAKHPVIAVEADGELVTGLEERFAKEIGGGELTLVHDDIRQFSIDTYLKEGESYSLVANIPYYITGEIIRTFLTSARKPTSMTLLVQKEVAERIARTDVKNPKESLLSLSVKAFGTPRYCFTVPRGAFKPAPNVDSAVISIDSIRPDAFPSSEAEERFFSVLRAGFAHKRKVLIGNLEVFAPREALISVFEKVGIDLKMRPEDLSLEDWQRLIANLPS